MRAYYLLYHCETSQNLFGFVPDYYLVSLLLLLLHNKNYISNCGTYEARSTLAHKTTPPHLEARIMIYFGLVCVVVSN